MTHLIPKKAWIKAYLAVCGWYLINLALGSFVTYYFFSPQLEEVWHGAYLFLFYAVYLALVWLWTVWLWRFPTSIQIAGQLLGCLLGWLLVSWVGFQLSIYTDNRIADSFDLYLLTSYSGTKVSGRLDAFRLYTEYVALIFIAYVLRYAHDLQRREQEKAQLSVKNKDMEMSLLKAQVNPHFLFNTLNSISMLVGISKSKARRVIAQLSDILRYTLELGDKKTVTISEEIALVKNFLQIQQVRFEDVFQFEIDIPESVQEVHIPPMTLQPLTENAIKHGVGKRTEGGLITIFARQENRKLYIAVKDNGTAGNHSSSFISPSTGIGLNNTDQRLQNILGPQSALQVQDFGDKGFEVGFWVNLP